MPQIATFQAHAAICAFPLVETCGVTLQAIFKLARLVMDTPRERGPAEMAEKTRRALVAIVALSLPLLAQTQTRPSFAGKWERVPEKGTQSVTPPGFPPVPPLTISQDATTITVSKLVFRPPVTVNGQPSGETQQWAYSLTYTFDGKEHPESAPVPPLPAGVAASPGTDPKYIAEWRGAQLVITTRATGRTGVPTETKVTYSIDKEGLLVVETVRTTGNQPAPSPSRSVYRKVS